MVYTAWFATATMTGSFAEKRSVIANDADQQTFWNWWDLLFRIFSSCLWNIAFTLLISKSAVYGSSWRARGSLIYPFHKASIFIAVANCWSRDTCLINNKRRHRSGCSEDGLWAVAVRMHPAARRPSISIQTAVNTDVRLLRRMVISATTNDVITSTRFEEGDWMESKFHPPRLPWNEVAIFATLP